MFLVAGCSLCAIEPILTMRVLSDVRRRMASWVRQIDWE
jgi:hypothetical protein